jgi:hypothetical protein
MGLLFPNHDWDSSFALLFCIVPLYCFLALFPCIGLLGCSIALLLLMLIRHVATKSIALLLGVIIGSSCC